MKKVLTLALLFGFLSSGTAQAGLCKNVRNLKDGSITESTKRDVNFFKKLFPYESYHGNRRWNEVIVQCNRHRDRRGNKIAKVTAAIGGNLGKNILMEDGLKAKIIRGKFNFFGHIFAQQKYAYVLSKKNNVWTMVIPYKPIIKQFRVNRIDLNLAHAGVLYDVSQVAKPSSNGTFVLNPNAKSIAQMPICTNSVYFFGKENKYKNKGLHQRDKQNKHISIGKIEYKYKKDAEKTWVGCRVKSRRHLYWRPDKDDNKVIKVKPKDWILDNFVRVAESYWSIKDVFKLRLLMKGRNESEFDESILKLFKDKDYLTVRFATKFLPHHFNQMYKSNPIQFYNFSTMTTDGTHRHEVGHAFGLDDEYGDKKKDGTFKKNGCKNKKYADEYETLTYQMCRPGVDKKRLIYHYLAVSRYIIQ